MKNLVVIVMVIALLLATTGIAFADSGESLGPNPDAGDCIPNDGSPDFAPNGPDGNNVGIGSGHMVTAPNSGDGIPDGPGW
jgi:hypothetical protein